MSDVAVLIKTLRREEALLTCLRSVRIQLAEQAIPYRIYLADDGPVSDAKRDVYRRLRDGGHVVVEFDEEVGASRARNEMADRLEDEAHVLRMDDDFELTGESDVAAMRSVLERVPGLGAVGDLERQAGLGKGVFPGGISDGQGFFERRDDVLVRRMLPPGAFDYERVGPHRYTGCDFTRNMLLIRREVLEEVRWDERLPFAGEHEDFMLQLHDAGWNVAFTPDSIHRHREDLAARGRTEERDERSRKRAEAMEVFREKWGIREKTVRRTPAGTVRAGLILLAKKVGLGP